MTTKQHELLHMLFFCYRLQYQRNMIYLQKEQSISWCHKIREAK
jgi:hypothetical protein